MGSLAATILRVLHAQITRAIAHALLFPEFMPLCNADAPAATMTRPESSCEGENGSKNEPHSINCGPRNAGASLHQSCSHTAPVSEWPCCHEGGEPLLRQQGGFYGHERSLQSSTDAVRGSRDSDWMACLSGMRALAARDDRKCKGRLTGADSLYGSMNAVRSSSVPPSVASSITAPNTTFAAPRDEQTTQHCSRRAQAWKHDQAHALHSTDLPLAMPAWLQRCVNEGMVSGRQCSSAHAAHGDHATEEHNPAAAAASTPAAAPSAAGSSWEQEPAELVSVAADEAFNSWVAGAGASTCAVRSTQPDASTLSTLCELGELQAAHEASSTEHAAAQQAAYNLTTSVGELLRSGSKSSIRSLQGSDQQEEGNTGSSTDGSESTANPRQHAGIAHHDDLLAVSSKKQVLVAQHRARRAALQLDLEPLNSLLHAVEALWAEGQGGLPAGSERPAMRAGSSALAGAKAARGRDSESCCSSGEQPGCQAANASAQQESQYGRAQLAGRKGGDTECAVVEVSTAGAAPASPIACADVAAESNCGENTRSSSSSSACTQSTGPTPLPAQALPQAIPAAQPDYTACQALAESAGTCSAAQEGRAPRLAKSHCSDVSSQNHQAQPQGLGPADPCTEAVRVRLPHALTAMLLGAALATRVCMHQLQMTAAVAAPTASRMQGHITHATPALATSTIALLPALSTPLQMPARPSAAKEPAADRASTSTGRCASAAQPVQPSPGPPDAVQQQRHYPQQQQQQQRFEAESLAVEAASTKAVPAERSRCVNQGSQTPIDAATQTEGAHSLTSSAYLPPSAGCSAEQNTPEPHPLDSAVLTRHSQSHYFEQQRSTRGGQLFDDSAHGPCAQLAPEPCAKRMHLRQTNDALPHPSLPGLSCPAALLCAPQRCQFVQMLPCQAPGVWLAMQPPPPACCCICEGCTSASRVDPAPQHGTSSRGSSCRQAALALGHEACAALQGSPGALGTGAEVVSAAAGQLQDGSPCASGVSGKYAALQQRVARAAGGAVLDLSCLLGRPAGMAGKSAGRL